MKRALFLFFVLGACRTPSNNVVASKEASVVEEEEGEEVIVTPEGGACPRPINPDYCRHNCRSFASRQTDKHAKRVEHSQRVGFGKCGDFDVFAEDEQPGDGGVGSGLVEYFDRIGTLVGAVDTRAKPCTQFGRVPTCTPQITWEESHAFTIRLGAVDAPNGLPPEVVRRIVRANLGRFRSCAQKDAARPAGNFAVKVHIGKDGSVSSVEDDGSTFRGPTASDCLTKIFRATTFPEPQAAMTARVVVEFSN